MCPKSITEETIQAIAHILLAIIESAAKEYNFVLTGSYSQKNTFYSKEKMLVRYKGMVVRPKEDGVSVDVFVLFQGYDDVIDRVKKLQEQIFQDANSLIGCLVKEINISLEKVKKAQD
ncbi:hypothetical protein [Neobacillus terrae]|uniref:hypothetical protein n=1 Tax=Neobacillus terrae TaxID=3034837 RepID=UPI00140C559A|nr:hypothetical protein [Neobacillus terrae]NHM29662.1 hypothetical protein [Neobacillus terrae]